MSEEQQIPSLPPGLDAEAAARWATAVLFRASIEHQWSGAELRRALVMTLCGTIAITGDSESVTREFAEMMVMMRSLRTMQGDWQHGK
jgi:hypothetical protein